VRIGLGLFCIVAISVAESHSQSAQLYVHKLLLIAIDRELEEGEPSRVRHALSLYDRTFQSTHDFMMAPEAAMNDLEEGQHARRLEKQKRVAPGGEDGGAVAPPTTGPVPAR